MTRDTLLNRLLEYVGIELLHGDAADLSAQTPLLEWGVIDSLSMVSMLAFIEDELHIVVPDTMVRPEHFSSLDALADLLHGLVLKRSAA